MENRRLKPGRKFTTKEVVINGFFFLGLILNIVNFKLFEKTIINWWIVSAIYIGSALFYLPLRNVIRNWLDWGSFSWMVFCMIVFGSLISFSLLGINFVFKDDFRYKEDFPIVGKYFAKRRKSVVATIIVNNVEKDFRFPRSLEKDTYKARVITLDLSNGFLGISVINKEEIK